MSIKYETLFWLAIKKGGNKLTEKEQNILANIRNISELIEKQKQVFEEAKVSIFHKMWKDRISKGE